MEICDRRRIFLKAICCREPWSHTSWRWYLLFHFFVTNFPLMLSSTLLNRINPPLYIFDKRKTWIIPPLPYSNTSMEIQTENLVWNLVIGWLLKMKNFRQLLSCQSRPKYNSLYSSGSFSVWQRNVA